MVLGSLSLPNLTLRPRHHSPDHSPWRETSPSGALGSSAEMPSGHQGAEAPKRGMGLPLQRAGLTPPDLSAEGTGGGQAGRAPQISPCSLDGPQTSVSDSGGEFVKTQPDPLPGNPSEGPGTGGFTPASSPSTSDACEVQPHRS